MNRPFMFNIKSSLPERPVDIGGGTTVSCFVDGRGPLKLVLLHGLNSYSGTWKKNVPALSAICSICAPTLPRVRTGTTQLLLDAVTALSDVVLSLCDRLDYREFIVAGNSMGGWLGAYMAIAHPERVSGLILVDSAGLDSSQGHHSGHPAAVYSRLPEISQPTLIVWGSNDMVIPVEYAHLFHRQIPGSELEIFDGAGHIPHLERPDEFNEMVLDFLRRSFMANLSD